MPRQGQEKGTPARRAEFIERLRALGPGHFCIAWPWSATQGSHDRYTMIHVNGEKVGAHRWVYEQVYGVDLVRTHKRGAGEQVVRHTCDNRACVRPSHLALGTQLENMRDASEKGRLSDDKRRKLSDDDVARIRQLKADGNTQASIARAFGVSDATVHLIVTNRSRTGKPHGNRRLDAGQVEDIRRLVRSGVTQVEAGARYGVTGATVSEIMHSNRR